MAGCKRDFGCKLVCTIETSKQVSVSKRVPASSTMEKARPFVSSFFHICYDKAMRAVFLDRDGTVNVGTPTYERVDSVEKVELLPHTLQALSQLAGLDYRVFFVTNQAGLAEGIISESDFDAINDRVLQLVEPSGIKIEKTFVCPHGEASNCNCRKPKPGLLQNAAIEYEIDLANSWMIGDRPSDVMTGVNAGTKTILVKTGVPTVESPEATATLPSLLEAVEFIASKQ